MPRSRNQLVGISQPEVEPVSVKEIDLPFPSSGQRLMSRSGRLTTMAW